MAAAETPPAGLLSALLAVQAEAPKLTKDATNPHFHSRYTSLDTIVETMRPLLTEHGLTWSAFPCFGPDGQPALRYRLAHAASGEAMEDTMPLMVGKGDSQGLGSALTYARRYSLTAVLNLAADEDDDGNAASRRQQNGSASATSPQPTARPAQAGETPASAKQRGLILARASEAGMPASFLANLVLIAKGADPREFPDEQAAQDWLKRGLDRLLAKDVTPILENIAREVEAMQK